MSLIPRLPDTAPFSPAQRAWLDGFISGLLGNDAEPFLAATPEPEDEDLPWHDPLLSLDERLELSAGRRPAHVLMSAMAQLDCGQCGYFCETYAAAIAGGGEPSLSRCVPGGKATSRKLKELLAEIGAPAEPKATVPAASAAPILSPEVGPAAQFTVRLRQAMSLHAPGAEKDTRHVVLEAVDGELPYRVGDSLGVVARNCPDLVGAIIERLAASPDAFPRLGSPADI